MATLINKVFRRLRLVGVALRTGFIPDRNRIAIPSITPEEVAEARVFFPLDKFFVFGHARSGTTLLTRLIRLHPDVHCNYQGHFFTRPPTIESLVNRSDIEAWFTRRSNRWNQGSDLSPLVLRVVVDFIMEREARSLGVTIVGDKSPNSLLNGEAVKRLHKVYPDGKLIFIVRDGRDAVVSHRFQTFIDASHHLTKQDWAIRTAFEYQPKLFLQGTRSIFTKDGIRKAAEGWARNVNDTDFQGKLLFNGKYISLRYEDLLSDPWGQMIRLWSFLGLEVSLSGLQEKLDTELSKNPDKIWQKKKAGNLTSPLHKGKSGSWRDLFTVYDKLVFRKIAGETLIEWGYENNMDW